MAGVAPLYDGQNFGGESVVNCICIRVARELLGSLARQPNLIRSRAAAEGPGAGAEVQR